MSMAANFDITGNTTFYFIKQLHLVLLSGSVVIILHVLRQLVGRSGLLLSLSSPLEFPVM